MDAIVIGTILRALYAMPREDASTDVTISRQLRSSATSMSALTATAHNSGRVPHVNAESVIAAYEGNTE